MDRDGVSWRARFHAFFAAAVAMSGLGAVADEPGIIAVLACDPMADIKKQVEWVDIGYDEKALPYAQRTSLGWLLACCELPDIADGLDFHRPFGLVVSAVDNKADLETPQEYLGRVRAHAYVPFKDFKKLFGRFGLETGGAPGVWRFDMGPGVGGIEVVEKNGWAIICFTKTGHIAPVADPSEVFANVLKDYTVGVQAYPSRMPPGTLKILDPVGLLAQFFWQDLSSISKKLIPWELLQEAESWRAGLAIDVDERVFVETSVQMTPATPAAAACAVLAEGACTVHTPAAAEGTPTAVSAHLAMRVPESLGAWAIAHLGSAAGRGQADGGVQGIAAVGCAAIAAMIESGGCDAALTIDTSVVTDATELPLVTFGMKVQDGAAFEARLKEIVADAGEHSGLTVAFDTGRAAGANLHTATLEHLRGWNGPDGEPLVVTLAVTPRCVYVLAGGDVAARLAAVVGAGDKPDPKLKPMAEVSVALAPLLRYAAMMVGAAKAAGATMDGSTSLEASAKVAGTEASALVQMLVRPMERGMVLRWSADTGAVRTIATAWRESIRK